MDAQTIQPFKTTLTQLEQLIRQLEVNVGVEHRPSPFEKFLELPQPVVQQKVPQQQEEQKDQQNKEEQKKNTQEKKEKQPKQAPAKQAPPQAAEQIPEEYADLVAVDIRVGEIHPESEKLYCEKINIGTETREIASGLQQFVPIEQMSGLVLVLANLKGRKLAGFMSTGMVLCASNADHSQVEVLRPQPGSKIGERVKIAGLEHLFKEELEAALNPKKKQWENVQPQLKTTENKEASFNGQVFVTSAGTILSQSLVNASIS